MAEAASSVGVVAFQLMVEAGAAMALAATAVEERTMGMAMQMVRAAEVAFQALRVEVAVPLMGAESFDHDHVHDPFALASSMELARPRKADADDRHAIVDFVRQANVLQQIHAVHPWSPS